MSKTKNSVENETESNDNAGTGKLIVVSQVRALVKSLDMQVSGDLMDALSARVEQLIKTGVLRAAANGRKTLRPSDI